MFQAISGVIIFTIIAKLLGFIRELALSYFFGATGISDAYLISQTIPGTIFQFVGTGLTTCFIPVYYKVMKEHGVKECNEFTNKVLTMVLSFSTIVMVVVWLYAPEIVGVFASGFSGNTLKYAIAFTRIGISSLYFSSIIYVYNSYLQANNIFLPTAAAAIPNSFAIIISIFFGAYWNIWALSIGSVFATAIQMVFLCIPVYKLKFKLHFNFKWTDSYIKYFFSLMGPVILGVSVNEINTLFDRTIASQVAVGGISALTYANSLIMMVQGGLAQPIATVYYPTITEKIAEGKKTEAKKDFDKSLEILLAILLPITVGFMIFSKEIVITFFGRGAFDEKAVELTATSLVYYSIGIVFIGIRELLARYYYAYRNTRIPMQNAAVGMCVNIILNLTFSRFIGIGGLALATSISALVTVILMWQQRNKLDNDEYQRFDWEEVKKIVGASIIMGLILFGLKGVFGINGLIQLFGVVIIGMASYGVIIWKLHVKCVFELTSQIVARKKKYE